MSESPVRPDDEAVADELAKTPQFRSDVGVDLVKATASDSDVVFAARVSTAGEQSIDALHEDPERSAGLIRYLMRERHGSPYEHNSMTFLVTAPIFVFREFHRHRIGWCLTGDTKITFEADGGKSGRTLRHLPIEDVYRRWHHGERDELPLRESIGSTRARAEAGNAHGRPGVRTGVLPVSRDLTVVVLNEETGLFETARVGDIYDSGVKQVIEIRADGGRTLRCSTDHAVYTNAGWVKAGELDAREHLVTVAGIRGTFDGRRHSPTLRSGIGATKATSEQRLARRESTAGAQFVRFSRTKDAVAEVQTYDLAVAGPWHNFLANGLVVHNSYNEESGRYRELEPVFYVPAPERKLTQTGKPGHYVFVDGSPEQYETTVEATKRACATAYAAYQEMLAAGVAREVARGVLPVATFSSMYATCNARSLMSFLSLRTKREDSTFPSYPQREIEMVAEKMEAEWAKLMPITHAAFDAAGRVSP